MPRVLLLLAAAVALAVIGRWQLTARLSTHVYDPSGEAQWGSPMLFADIQLTLWILAWDARALVTATTGIRC